MKIDTKKELSNEFGSNIFFDYDLNKFVFRTHLINKLKTL